jgi:hypothetical protein
VDVGGAASKTTGGKWRWHHSLDASARSGHRHSDSEANRWAPHVLNFIHIIQNQFKLVKSKWMSYNALDFCMTLELNILNEFLNCDDFKFPT